MINTKYKKHKWRNISGGGGHRWQKTRTDQAFCAFHFAAFHQQAVFLSFLVEIKANCREQHQMKKRLYQVTALAAGSIVLSAAVHSGPLQETICDSAMTGGAVWANATASLGNLGQILSAEY